MKRHLARVLCPVLVALLFAPDLCAAPPVALSRSIAERVQRDPALLDSVIHRMPKVDLHRHLEGAIRAETFLAVAAKYGIELPATTVETLRPLVSMTENDHTLSDFMTKFKTISKIWVSLPVVEEISAQCVRDAAAEGCIGVELRFAPTSIARLKTLDPAQVTEAVIRGVRAAEAETGTVVSLVVIVPRYEKLDVAAKIEALAADFGRRGEVVGLDLAADESKFPPGPFAPIFQQAAKDGLHRTVHAGEALGPESVQVALDDLKAERIGHGVRVFSDPALVDRIVKSGIVLEMCPTSNVQTGAVGSLAEHPLKKFLDMGGRATVNTDDPGVCSTDLNREYRVAAAQLGLSIADLETLSQNAAEGMFLSPEKKTALLAKLRARLAELNASLEGPRRSTEGK